MKILCMQNWEPDAKFRSRKNSLIYEKMFVVRLSSKWYGLYKQLAAFSTEGKNVCNKFSTCLMYYVSIFVYKAVCM